jgi:hypothetical protein
MEIKSLNICQSCPSHSMERIDGKQNLIRLHCSNVLFGENTFPFHMYSYPFITPELKERGFMSISKKTTKVRESEMNKLVPVKKFEVPETCPYILEHVLINE